MFVREVGSDNPWAPVVLPSGRRARRRFERRLGDQLDARDAWVWLIDPAAAGPSGLPGPLTRVRSAQRAAFGPEAPQDAAVRLRELESRLLVDRRAARAALGTPRRSRTTGIAVLATTVAVTPLAAALLQHPSPSRTGSVVPAASSAPSATTTTSSVEARSLRTTAEERERLLGLFRLGDGQALRMRFQSAVDATADSLLVADGTLTSAPAAIIGGIDDDPSSHPLEVTPGGALTVGMVVSRPVPWHAVVTFDDGTRASVEATTIGGRLQYGLVLAPTSAAATAVAFALPSGVRYSWQVLHRG